MYIKFALRSLMTVIAFVALSAQADIYVIAHPGMLVAADGVKDVFTGNKQFIGSTKLQPVDNGPAQDEFLSRALGMNASRYNTLWTKKSFRDGLIPPPVKSGNTEVLEFVRKTQGAIGYITIPPSGVDLIRKY